MQSFDLLNTAISVVALVVSICSGAFVYFKERQEARWNRTLDLHSAFNSREFGQSRRRAIEFVERFSGVDWSSLVDIGELSGSDAAEPLYDIMRFYHRMWVLRRSGQLVDSELFSLFGPELAWWHGFLFSRMERRRNWRTGSDIQSLVRWMKNRAGAEEWRRLEDVGRQSRLQSWVSGQQ